MTVCIAAICERPDRPTIIGVSDRMLTAGDIEFERPAPKYGGFGQSIIAMIAGDASIQDEVCQRALHGKQHGFATVAGAVAAYCAEVSAYRVRLAERVVLAPLGLNMNSFIGRQHEFSTSFVEQIRYEMAKAHSSIELATIITGLDAEGSHIYTIDHEGMAYCNDSVGFAAVGSGARHANSHFMFTRYTADSDIGRAVLAVYAAKRRAEVAPGVGEETDMFIIPCGKPMTPINQRAISDLRKAYKTMDDSQKTAIETANEEIRQIFYQAAIDKAASRKAADANAVPSGDSPWSRDGQPPEASPEPNPTDQAQTN